MENTEEVYEWENAEEVDEWENTEMHAGLSRHIMLCLLKYQLISKACFCEVNYEVNIKLKICKSV